MVGTTITDEIKSLQATEGLEFVREWDKARIAMAVLTCLDIFGVHSNLDSRFPSRRPECAVVVSTAGSYIVTVGASPLPHRDIGDHSVLR